MLKAAIDAEIFREAIDVIAALVTECRLHIGDEGINTRAVDTANVAMVSLEVSKDAFQSFAATEDELGLDIQKMKNIIGMMSRGDNLALNMAPEGHKLELSFSGYKYSVTLLDVNTIRKSPKPPSIELPGLAVIAGSELNSAIKAAAVISDKIAIGIDPAAGIFYMEAEGDTDHIRLDLGEDKLVSLKAAEARSLFSLDYLKDMGKVMSRAEQVEVHLGIDHPVRFIFDIADGGGKVEYLLAPRIEAD
jgi:proliferating cell nuclear antigen